MTPHLSHKRETVPTVLSRFVLVILTETAQSPSFSIEEDCIHQRWPMAVGHRRVKKGNADGSKSSEFLRMKLSPKAA